MLNDIPSFGIKTFYQNYSQAELKLIKKELEKTDFINILLAHKFPFTFNIDFLQSINDFFQKIIPHINNVSLLTLYFYLAWQILSSENEIVGFDQLFNTLIKLSSNTSGKIQALLISASYHSLCKYFDCTVQSESTNPLPYFKQFFSLNVKFDKRYFNILPSVINYILNLNDSNLEIEFLEFIGILIEEESKTISKKVSNDILSIIINQLSNQFIIILQFYLHLSKCLPEEDNISVISMFISSISHSITQGESFLKINWTNESTKHILPKITKYEILLEFNEKETFKNGIDLKSVIIFPEIIDFKHLIRNDILHRLSLILFATSNNENVFHSLLDHIKIIIKSLKNDKYKLDFYCLFLYLCYNSNDLLRENDINDVLLEPPFFDPNYTVFNKDENYKIINSLRFYVFNILTSLNQKYLHLILLKWNQEPYLFAEICHRIIQHVQNFQFDRITIKSLSKSLMKSSIYYQHLNYEMNNNTIEIARGALLLLISNLLLNQENLILFFNEYYFISFFLSFLFEKSLCQFVLTNLYKYFTNNKTGISENVINFLQKIIQVCLPLFPEENYVKLVTEIINVMNNTFIILKTFQDSYDSFCFLLLKSNINTNNSESMKNFVLQFLQFCDYIFSFKVLNESQLNFLFNLIQNTFGNKIPKKLLQKIIQLLAGECITSFEPIFTIRQPNILKYLIKIVLNNSKLIKIIKFINDLVLFSKKNAIQCNNSKFDLYLIDLIKSQNNEEVIKSLLNLFQNITILVSSVDVVQHYITLFSPINNEHISEFYDLYLQTMNSIIMSSTNYPTASIPMIYNQAAIEINGITGVELDEGFTFTFWIYLESSISQYTPYIFFVQDKTIKDKSILAFISEGHLFIKFQTYQDDSTGKVDLDIPTEKWVFIALRFYSNENFLCLVPYIGCNQGRPLEFELFPFQLDNISFHIAGSCINSTTPLIPSRFGTFGIFPELNNETITLIWLLGPHGKGKLPINPYVFVTMEEENGFVKLNPLINNNKIDVKLKQNDIKSEINFFTSLIYLCKIEILLPLFEQVNKITMKKNYFPLLLNIIVELFGNIFSLSTYAQNSFYNSHGFQIISYLLLILPDKFINYSLFIQFNKLMLILTNEKLQLDLLYYIILEPEIWLKTDAESHLKILRYWDRTIFPSMLNILSKQFQQILYFMRVYYWYNISNEEKEFIKCEKRVRGEVLNVLECRQLLSHIAILLANESFTNLDYQCLMSHCLTCSDSRQVNDLLIIIKGICEINYQILISDEIDIVSFLYMLLPRRNHEMICLIIEIIILFYHNNILFDPPLNYHLENIISQLSPSIINKEFFYRVGESIQNNYFEMFQILCWIGINKKIDDDDILLMIQQLKPNEKFVTSFNWCFWPIVLCIYRNSFNIQYNVLMFLNLCSNSQWENIYLFIHIISLALNINSYNIENLFLNCIVEIIENNSKDKFKEISIFSSILCTFLFSNNNNFVCNEKLINDYKESPFFSQYTLQSLNKTNLNQINKQKTRKNVHKKAFSYIQRSHHDLIDDILIKIESNNKHNVNNNDKTPNEIKDIILNYQYNYHNSFHIRIDSNGKLNDSELIESAINLYIKYPNKQYLKFYLYILSILIHEKPEFSIKSIKTILLNLTKEDIQLNINYFYFFHKHCKKIGIKFDLFNENVIFKKKEFKSFQKELKNLPNLNKFASQILITLQEIFNSTIDLIHSLNYFQDDLVSISLTNLTLKNEEILLKRNQSQHFWLKLWRMYSYNPTSWSKNFYKNSNLKRDNTLCNDLLPIKLKINWKEKLKFKEIEEDELNLQLNYITNEENNGLLYSNLQCNLIKTFSTKKISFDLYLDRIEIKFSSSSSFEDKINKIYFREIKYLFCRSINNIQQNSIEIFTYNGKTYLIQFDDAQQAFLILRRISFMHVTNIKLIQINPFLQNFHQYTLTPLWVRNKISNFSYIIHLNLMSGRTFNDLSQYPIFPWVLNDYNSLTLDLTDKKIYRKFSDSINKENVLSKEIVLKYLSNLEPFKSKTNERIDTINNLFLSKSFELIPEFYYDFDFLKIENLPKWSNDSIFEFIYIMRKALESDIVSENLCFWFDLIWGINNNNKIPKLFTSVHPYKHLNQIEPLIINKNFVMFPNEQNLNILFVKIERIKKLTYKIFLINNNGQIVIHLFDFINNKRNRNIQRNNSQNIIPIVKSSNSLHFSGSDSSLKINTQNEEEIENKINVTSSTKEINDLTKILKNINVITHINNSLIGIISSKQLYVIDLNKFIFEKLIKILSEYVHKEII